MAKKIKIDVARYNKVLWSRVCPGCGDYKVVDVVRRGSNEEGGSTFRGTFHACGGPDGHLCWNMSKMNLKRPNAPLYESFGK